MKNILLYPLILFSFHAYCQNDLLQMDWANLEKYAAANAIMKPPAAKEQRIVFMGNSITEGWLNIDSSFFTGKPYVDRGISGQTTPQMLVRFRQDVVDLKPAAVVILAGTNDIAENTGPVTLDFIFGNIVSMAQLAKANHIRVILCAVLPVYDYPWHQGLEPAQKIRDLNVMIRSYCTQQHIVYVDYYSAMADERGGLDKKYSDDGVHPTLAGYRVMEPLVEKAIKVTLQQKQ
ncbi:MAG: SGNH/GDSL hydrolase family protein [Chitinophagales bacterium]|nr:SGNH/GDSL hydrolase family protein [Chitinophagales bacterium]